MVSARAGLAGNTEIRYRLPTDQDPGQPLGLVERDLVPSILSGCCLLDFIMIVSRSKTIWKRTHAVVVLFTLSMRALCVIHVL